MSKQMMEVIGLVAVFAGLIFVGLEIRQNNQLAQAAAYQTIGHQTAQNWHEMSQDPEFNRVLLRHWFADADWWADQNPQDVERMITSWIGWLRQYETLYLQVELGLLDEVAMERLGWGVTRDLPAVKHLWPYLGKVVGPEFAEYLTANWDEVPQLSDNVYLD